MKVCSEKILLVSFDSYFNTNRLLKGESNDTLRSWRAAWSWNQADLRPNPVLVRGEFHHFKNVTLLVFSGVFFTICKEKPHSQVYHN